MNSPGGEMVSNVEITGIPVSWVLEQAGGVKEGATALMATALVLVDDKVLFVTASSLATGNSPADDAAWVAAAAEAFADALASAAKK